MVFTDGIVDEMVGRVGILEIAILCSQMEIPDSSRRETAI